MEKLELVNGATVTPVATVKEGTSYIIKDDKCFVLVNKVNDTQFKMSHWWFSEAIEALKKITQ